MHVKEGLQNSSMYFIYFISPNIMLRVPPHLWWCDTCLERRAKTDNDLESYTSTLYIFTHMHIHCISYTCAYTLQINVRGKVKKKLFGMGKPIYTCAHTINVLTTVIKWVNVRNSSHVWHGKISGGGGKYNPEHFVKSAWSNEQPCNVSSKWAFNHLC